MKGKNYLKVTGILMIIGAAFGIIFGIIAVLGSSAAAVLLDASVGALMFASLLSLFSAAIELVAGILGIKYCMRPEKANVCLGFGIAVAVLSVVGNIISMSLGTEFSFFSLIIGLVLPILYIIGAVFNKKPQQNDFAA